LSHGSTSRLAQTRTCKVAIFGAAALAYDPSAFGKPVP
jgi:hypothetical protein